MSNTSEPRLKTLSGLKRPRDAPWGLSPSDFAFLWDDCPQCFYRKVVQKEPRPRAPFPSVFGRIDRAMKDFYLGKRAESLAEGMPVGVIGGGDRWVKSAPFALPGSAGTGVIRGKVDVLVECDDGSLGVVDFKTTIPMPDHVATYSRQVHAYAWALEHPASGPAAEVGALGLLCFLPDSYEARGDHAGLYGNVEWIGVPRDDEAFVRFLIEVVGVLNGSDPPPASPNCPWCGLREPQCVAA